MNMLDRVVAVVLLGASCVAQDATRSPGWVVIPVREYEALRGKAYPVEREAEPESTPATLTRVDYDLRIDGVVASGRASLTDDVLKDGWVRVPIPQGLLVRDARLGGESVSLVPTPGRIPQLSVVLSKKGRSVLMLDVAFTVASAGGEERLSLPVGASGVSRLPTHLQTVSSGSGLRAKSESFPGKRQHDIGEPKCAAISLRECSQ